MPYLLYRDGGRIVSASTVLILVGADAKWQPDMESAPTGIMQNLRAHFMAHHANGHGGLLLN